MNYNEKTILDLGQKEIYLPSPKVRQKDRTGVHSWSKFYSAFSESFAIASLSGLRRNVADVVLDPFLGSGTSAVAALKCGNPFIGVDIDPFSVLLSRAKIATGADIDKVVTLLTKPVEVELCQSFCKETSILFSLKDLIYAQQVFVNISRDMERDKDSCWEMILNAPTKSFDDHAVALAAMVIAAQSSCKIAIGSNPVWKRIPVPGEIIRVLPLKQQAIHNAQKMCQDLSSSDKQRHSRAQLFKTCDARSLDIPDNSVDFVLTSPPYLNRLDYVVDHLPALTLLSGFVDINIDRLRRQMIGTTKINEKNGKIDKSWGRSCAEVLSAIKQHKSKASDSYYYWTYYQYFKDMYTILTELERKCKKGALGLFVLQNSYYKEIDIPTSKIICEMARNIGFKSKVIRCEDVRTHLGTLNPNLKKNAPNKQLTEKVIRFAF